MKAITRTILSALASAGEESRLLLPLTQDLYPEASLRAAAEAFSGLCRIEVTRTCAGRDRMLSLSVLPGLEGQSRRIYGELLNFLLDHGVREHLGLEHG